MPHATAQSYNEYQAEHRRKQRRSERDIEIPDVADPARREAAEADVYEFLSTYFAEKFDGGWTDDRTEMVEAVLYRAKHGGDQGIAAARGDGKTTIAETVVGVYCIVTGVLRFPLLVAATGPDAKRLLDNIKYEYETNDRLAEDYPEVCVPIRHLGGAPQGAGTQTVGGERTMMKWAQDHVIFPTVPGSKASGAILSTRGLDGAIRGVRYRNTRPDFVLIDDPETRESAASETQTKKREDIIEQDLAGVGGPGKRISRAMFCTIMHRDSLAARYTDPHQKPSWNGKRYRLLREMPEREDLWDEYMVARQAGMEAGDRDARNAHQFYVDNRKEMDRGAVVSNPERYTQDPLPSGEPVEISALQHCYNIIADRGWAAFQTEYQNDPPDDDGPQTNGISASLVRTRHCGLDRGIVPNDAYRLTGAIDVGKRACHYTFKAWFKNGAGHAVDYGVIETVNPDRRGAEAAIWDALAGFKEALDSEGYCRESGEAVEPDLILVDSGDWESVIVEFCEQAGAAWKPAKGFGSGPRNSPFRAPRKDSREHRAGDNWYMSRQQRGHWLVGMNADHWKGWLHERYITQPWHDDGSRRAGSMTIWGNSAADHIAFSKHITAEIEEEEFVPGKGVVRKWKQMSRNNHWLDAGYMASVAGSMVGVKVDTGQPKRPTQRRRRKRAKADSDWLTTNTAAPASGGSWL